MRATHFHLIFFPFSAAVLNSFGLGSAKSRKGLGDQLLRDSDEEGADNDQNGHSNGHLDSSADEGAGQVNEDQMVAEDEEQMIVQSTPGNSLFAAPPGTVSRFGSCYAGIRFPKERNRLQIKSNVRADSI